MALFGQNGELPQAIDLHEHEHTSIGPINLPAESLAEIDARRYNAKMKRVLPYLALNEVIQHDSCNAFMKFIFRIAIFAVLSKLGIYWRDIVCTRVAFANIR